MRIALIFLCSMVCMSAMAQKDKFRMTTAFKTSDKLVRKGNNALRGNKLDKAEELFKQALKENPWAYDAQSFLGIIEMQRNNPSGAVTLLGEGLKLFETYKKEKIEDKKAYLDKLTQQRMASANPSIEEEQRIFQKAEQLKGEIEDDGKLIFPSMFRFQLANAHLMVNQLEEAKAQYLVLLDLDPEFKDAYANVSICLFNLGDVEKAYEFYETGKKKGTKFHPDFVTQLKQRAGK